MRSVLLRLEGPMQSWGTQSRFSERDTDVEPSKSGVVGLVCAALGVRRQDSHGITRVATMRMAVRVDREGTVFRDYQTAGGGRWRGKEAYGVMGSEGKLAGTVLSNRYYLADASFLVALGTPDSVLVDEVARALAHPVFPLCLGRRAFPPALPILEPPGTIDVAPEAALRAHPLPPDPPARLRLVVEAEANEGVPRQDVPHSFDTLTRKYTRRFVRTEWIETGALPHPAVSE